MFFGTNYLFSGNLIYKIRYLFLYREREYSETLANCVYEVR